MPNSIALAKNYTDLLDEVYKRESVTADLISDASMMREGRNANEIYYPHIEVSGLGDYSRNSGYTDGTVNVEWKSTAFNYDRGTKITVDAMDDEETFNIAFGMAGGELIRTKVAPEGDAFTFATIAGKQGISSNTATIANAGDFLDLLAMANSVMDEDEVPGENRLLYATPTLINSIMRLDTFASREVLNTFAAIKKVPQKRFYTKIDLLDGKTAGEEAGHYVKAADGREINFMVIHKPAIIKFDKHVVSSVISPDNNPNADSYIAKYRKYGLVDVYANKLAGVYVSAKPASGN